MRSTIRFTVIAVGAAAALALTTGCSSSEDTAASGESADTCNTFAVDHNELVGLVTAGPGSAEKIESWTDDKQAAVDKLKTLPAAASADVASAMTTFVSALPADTLELAVTDSPSGKAFLDNGAAVESACEADGTAITLDELPLLKFEN